MTEHSAVVFVFFFLAEYSSLVLICTLTTILFVGGYNVDFSIFVSILDILKVLFLSQDNNFFENIFFDVRIENLIYGLILAIKSFIIIFTFIWARASFPRIRYDQLMSYCWTVLLPIVFGFVILIPCLMNIMNIMPSNLTFFS